MKISYKPLFLIFGVITILWSAFGALVIVCSVKYETKGQFGDSFGALNTLFSGLAFAAFVYTVLLQRHELELQRREMELTREELTGQKQQLSLQNDLTVLSARLSAIPLLLTQEALSIQKYGGEFKDWADRAYSTEELSTKISECKETLSNFIQAQKNAEVDYDKRDKKYDIYGEAQSELNRLQEGCIRYEAVIPKLTQYRELQLDLEAIYKKLKGA